MKDIFLGNKLNGEQAKNYYNLLVDEIRNKIKKGIQAIIHAGCMIVAKNYDDYENPPKRRKIKN